MYYGKKFVKPMVVPTGLIGNKATEVLCSVIGQMSDGKWENDPSYDKYWMHSDIDEDTNSIVVEKGDWGSGFIDMDEHQVRAFWCRKINAILKDWVAWNPRSRDDNCAYLTYHEKTSVDEIKQMVKQMKAYDKPKAVKKPKDKIVAEKVVTKVKTFKVTTLDTYF